MGAGYLVLCLRKHLGAVSTGTNRDGSYKRVFKKQVVAFVFEKFIAVFWVIKMLMITDWDKQSHIRKAKIREEGNNSNQISKTSPSLCAFLSLASAAFRCGLALYSNTLQYKVASRH